MGARASELSVVVIFGSLAAVWIMINLEHIVSWKSRWLELIRHWRLKERKP